MARIASGASFGNSREHALPAAQRKPCGAIAGPGRRAVPVTWDFMGRLDLCNDDAADAVACHASSWRPLAPRCIREPLVASSASPAVPVGGAQPVPQLRTARRVSGSIGLVARLTWQPGRCRCIGCIPALRRRTFTPPPGLPSASRRAGTPPCRGRASAWTVVAGQRTLVTRATGIRYRAELTRTRDHQATE